MARKVVAGMIIGIQRRRKGHELRGTKKGCGK